MSEVSNNPNEANEAKVAEIMEETSWPIEDAIEAYVELVGAEYANASDFEESYSGHYWTDEEFAQDMAEQIGSVDENASWPNNCIDWELAAKELMYDYSEHNGYYFRSI